MKCVEHLVYDCMWFDYYNAVENFTHYSVESKVWYTNVSETPYAETIRFLLYIDTQRIK